MKDDVLDEALIRQIFELTERNMVKALGAAATDATASYASWREALDRNLRAGIRHIICVRRGFLRGYLAYLPQPEQRDVYVNELQIDPLFQRGLTFKWLVEQFLEAIEAVECDTVRTYTNRRNENALRLLLAAGFKIDGETERGYRLSVTKKRLLERFRRS